MLHKEDSFVFLGESEKAATATSRCRLEHVVPCSYMIDELDKLIKRNEYSDEELATALQKKLESGSYYFGRGQIFRC